MPAEAALRLRVVGTLQQLYDSWGYVSVDPPILEHYDAAHPWAETSFKLSDAGSHVLALRADYTPAVARMVQLYYPDAAKDDSPQRFQYCGKLWRTIDPDSLRTREFTQIGLELVGISNARADAELVHLARESVRAVGLTPRVEIGNPGFVRELFDLAEVPLDMRETLADAIDRKDAGTVESLLAPLALAADLHRALLGVPDLYGDVHVVHEARRLAPWPETRAELERLEEVLEQFEDDSELLLDLGMARRLSYYTGISFRAYTFDFGQPLLGGGRYDHALLPCAAGFALGLERLLGALHKPADPPPPMVLSLDDPGARVLRAQGVVVERSLAADVAGARAYAKVHGIPYLLSEAGLEPLVANPPAFEKLSAALESARG